MKLVKQSLVIVIAFISSNAFAADSLSNMFKEGTINGTLSTYYFGKEIDGISGNILDIGLDLTYKTAVFNNFSAGFTIQSTHSPFVDERGKALYNRDMYGSGEILSEAYIKYESKDLFLKAGRQYIDTPLISGDDTKMTRQSFEGYIFGYTGLLDTTLMVGYISKFQRSTNLYGDIGEFKNVNKTKGAYTIYASNNSISYLKFQAQFAYEPDLLSLYYLQADYSNITSNFSYKLSGQYQVTNYNSTAIESNSGYHGIKAKVTMNGLNLSVAYSKIDDSTATIYGLGGGSDIIFTGDGTLHGGEYTAGDKAHAILLSYEFSKDVKLYGYYGRHNLPTLNSDYDITGGGASYAFNGSFRGLGLSAGYEVKNLDVTKNNKRLRFKAIYSF